MTIPASTIEILVDGVDIAPRVLFAESTFDMRANAIPGEFKITAKDPDMEFEPVTGKTVQLFIDGFPMFGGLLTNTGRTNFFPAVDTQVVANVRTRKHKLTGPDFNIWFDKRVIRDTSNYLSKLSLPGGARVGAAVRYVMDNYVDAIPGLSLSEVDDTNTTIDVDNRGNSGAVNQGQTLRDQIEQLAQFGAAVYYIDADLVMHFHDIEDVISPWLFTDRHPNGITSIGFREGEYEEDVLPVVTDALVWGGSALQDPEENDPEVGIGTVFSRYPSPPANTEVVLGNTLSADTETEAIARQAQYGRWQRAEMRVGEEMYLTEESVKLRAYEIVAGPPGADIATSIDTGLSRPVMRMRVSWFAHDVPRVGGVPQHLLPGHVASFVLYTMGESPTKPLVRTLPLRSLRVSFPTLPSNNPGQDMLTYVRFDGEFGLSYSDSNFLWKYLLRRNRRQTAARTASTTNTSSATARDAKGTFTLVETPDGVLTDFSVPFAYQTGTTEVFVNGLLWRRGVEYTELDSAAGTIRFAEPLHADDEVLVTCTTA
jgi:hypothetical protein